MATFEQLYGAWAVADEAARAAEAEMFAALASCPEVPLALQDRATALRRIANLRLDEAASRMRADAQPPRRLKLRWPFFLPA